LSFWWVPSIRHNEVRALTTSLLSEVCNDVGVEPALQPVEGKPNREDGASLDAVARDSLFLNVWVFNYFTRSCPDAISMRNNGHMMSTLKRLKELAFHYWY